MWMRRVIFGFAMMTIYSAIFVVRDVRNIGLREKEGNKMNWDAMIPLATMVFLAVLGMRDLAGTPCCLALPYFMFLEPMLPVQIIIQRFVTPVESTSYLAIPLFITAGVIMNYSGISKRLMDLADALVGHLTGGLGHVNIVLSVLMGGISGFGCGGCGRRKARYWVPEMEKRGYGREFSGAVTIASSLLTRDYSSGNGTHYLCFCDLYFGRAHVRGGICARPYRHDTDDDLRLFQHQKSGDIKVQENIWLPFVRSAS